MEYNSKQFLLLKERERVCVCVCEGEGEGEGERGRERERGGHLLTPSEIRGAGVVDGTLESDMSPQLHINRVLFHSLKERV